MECENCGTHTSHIYLTRILRNGELVFIYACAACRDQASLQPHDEEK